ncbi:DUF4118 domain-containing protein [Leuconostoc lactis]|nr:DUF4118 domain-containing protein [Leuconostoc lactis]QEA47969.1 DUF4118 domain-containing protein [Leuconostoc lactis]
MVETGDDIELIDIDPKVLLNRLAAGVIYPATRIARAQDHFFQLQKLTQLREIALQQSTRQLSEQNAQQGQQMRHFLVAISKSLSSDNAIRWAYRQASAFDAPWTVVHVQQSGKSLAPAVQRHMSLAKKLGAKTVILQGDHVVATLIAYIRETQVANLIIGKHVTRAWYQFGRSDIEDQILAAVPALDIQIIPNRDQVSPVQQLLTRPTRLRLSVKRREVCFAVGMIVTVTLINGLMTYVTSDNALKIMLYFVGIIFVSRFTQGYILGLATTVVSVLLFDLLFVQPFYSLQFYQNGYGIIFLAMFVTATLISSLTSKVTAQMAASVTAATQSQVLSDLSLQLLTDGKPATLSALTQQAILNYFKRPVAIYFQRQQFVGQIPTPDANSHEVMQWVWHHGLPAGAGTDTLAGKKAFYLPIGYQGHTLAILVGQGEDFMLADRLILDRFLTPLSAALKTFYLRQEAERHALEKLDAHLKSDLLQSVAHDLRTPLTGILASTALLRQDQTLTPANQHLLTNINHETNWLIQMIENILTVTRLQQGTIMFKTTPELVEELIFSAIEKFNWLHSQVHIDVQLPDEVIWIQAERHIFQQMLINLFDNAVKYGGPNVQIQIFVTVAHGQVTVTIQNAGQPFTAAQLTKINQQTRPNIQLGDQKRGLGIGLFLCQTIAKLHHSRLVAQNWQGGAEMQLVIPVNSTIA